MLLTPTGTSPKSPGPCDLDINEDLVEVQLQDQQQTTASIKQQQPPWPLPPIHWKVTICAVRGCPNQRNNVKINIVNGITFHRFPRNPHTCKKWQDFCDNEKLNDFSLDSMSCRMVVCSWHFNPDEISTDGRSRLVYNGLVPHVRPPRERNIIEVMPESKSLQDNHQVGQATESSEMIYLPVRPIPPKKKASMLRITNSDAFVGNAPQRVDPQTRDPFPDSTNNVMILPKPPAPLTFFRSNAISGAVVGNNLPRFITAQKVVGSNRILISQQPSVLQRVITSVIPAPNVQGFPRVAAQNINTMRPSSVVIRPSQNRLGQIHKVPDGLQLFNNDIYIKPNNNMQPQSKTTISDSIPLLMGAVQKNAVMKSQSVETPAKVMLSLPATSNAGAAVSICSVNSQKKIESTANESSGKQLLANNDGGTDIESQNMSTIQQIEQNDLLKRTLTTLALEPEMKRQKVSADSQKSVEMEYESDDEVEVKHGIGSNASIDSDIVHVDANPKLPGLEPLNQGKELERIPKDFSSASCFLYAVKDSALWNVPTGTLLSFKKISLRAVLSKKIFIKPNILSRKRIGGQLTKDQVAQIKLLGNAILQNDPIVPKDKTPLPPVSNEQKIAANKASESLLAPVASNLSESALTDGTRDPLILVEDTNTSSIQQNQANVKTGIAKDSLPVKSSPLKVVTTAIKPIQEVKTAHTQAPKATIYPVLGTLAGLQLQNPLPNLLPKVPVSTPQLQSQFVLMADGTIRSVVTAVQVQQSRHEQPITPTAEAPKQPKEPPKQVNAMNAKTVRIPTGLVSVLKEKLPMLVGKEGEFKVTKASFQQILDVLDELNYKVDRTGRVLSKGNKKLRRIANVIPGKLAHDPPKDQEAIEKTAKQLELEKKSSRIKGSVDKMYREIVLLRRRNKYLANQLEKTRKKQLSKQQKRDVTVETMKEVFTQEQFMFFMSQFTNATKIGSFGYRYEPELYEFCASLHLESRRVYRKLRMMFHLPNHNSIEKNVPSPAYFSLPKRKQYRKKRSNMDAPTSSRMKSGPVVKKQTDKNLTSNRKSLADIAREATQEDGQNCEMQQQEVIYSDDYSGIDELLQNL